MGALFETVTHQLELYTLSCTAFYYRWYTWSRVLLVFKILALEGRISIRQASDTVFCPGRPVDTQDYFRKAGNGGVPGYHFYKVCSCRKRGFRAGQQPSPALCTTFLGALKWII